MSVELIKKPITLDEMTKKESVQVIKERDLIVPDGKRICSLWCRLMEELIWIKLM